MRPCEEPIAQRRTRQHAIVVRPDLSVLFYEPGAIELLELTYGPQADTDHLPRPLEEIVRRRLVDGADDGPVDLGPAFARIALLEGVRDGFAVVHLAEQRRREHLDYAVAEFRLTHREREVLALLLRGHTTAEIAELLTLAETTAGDYVKSLLKKTGSRNRAELSARVLRYDGD